MRTATGDGSSAACLTSASAVYRPAGPDPITATLSTRGWERRPAPSGDDCIGGKLLGLPFRRRRRAGRRALLCRRARGRLRGAAGDGLGDLARQVLRRQPGRLEDLVT